MTLLPLALACRAPEPVAHPPHTTGSHTTPPPDDTVPTSPGTYTGATGTTGETGTEPLVYDCAAIPTELGPARIVDAARGYHDVAFAPDGRMIGASLFGDLLAADSAGNVALYASMAGSVPEQLAWLPDGDLAVASGAGIVRVTAAGATSMINADVHPYGLVVGPDGQLYAADQRQVYRVDPDTGASEVLIPEGALPSGAPRVLAFSLDYTRMFFGTFLGTEGRIYAVDLDADYDPVAPPTTFASGVGSGSYHDAMGVDICGYLYVPEYTSTSLYRVSPSGDEVVELVHSQLNHYGHGLEWGTTLGGWRDDALYITQPYDGNAVSEVVVEAPSREWPGTALHVPY